MEHNPVAQPLLFVLVGLLAGGLMAWLAATWNWPRHQGFVVFLLSFVLVATWRFIARSAHLDADFSPAVSIADVGSLFAGALGPTFVALRHTNLRHRWLAVVVGGVTAFVFSVGIL